MTNITTSAHWKALAAHKEELADTRVRDLFAKDADRFAKFSIKTESITLDYSKNCLTQAVLDHLLALTDECDLSAKVNQLFSGDIVNSSEQQPALHTALRDFSGEAVYVDGENIGDEIIKTRMRMQQLVDNLNGVTDVIHVGVGGSIWGPQLAYEALAAFRKNIACHFVGTHDRVYLQSLLKTLNPKTTAIIFVSKTFTTQEVLHNFDLLKQWSGNTEKIYAVSAFAERALARGLCQQNIFPMWSWVGGRYSLWSAVGLSVAIALGWESFANLLQGAHQMDQHFKQAPAHQNMPVVLACLNIWYQNFWQADSQAIIGYHPCLQSLVPHLQQLHMESLGKCVQQNGDTLTAQTGAVIWGGVGTGSQHTFQQALLQNNGLTPVDFILPVASVDKFMLANCLGSSQTLMQGYTCEEAVQDLVQQGMPLLAAKQLAPHKVIPGNQPSNTLLMPKLDPYHLGALLALYEHKVFVQSVMLNINAFDQWGVERSKTLANKVLQNLSQDAKLAGTQSTHGLLAKVEAMRTEITETTL